MLLKLDTVHLFSLDWTPFLCWRRTLDVAISLSVPSPLNVGVCKVNQDSAPQTLLQTWNYIIPLFPLLYWYFRREELHVHFFKLSPLRLAHSVFQPDHRLLHRSALSSDPSSGLGDWRRAHLQGVTAAAVPLSFSHWPRATDGAAVAGGGRGDSRCIQWYQIGRK